MPEYCDVALPVPLDQTFTYRIDGVQPVVGGRVLVPFGNQRLAGVVAALHDQPPPVAAKKILTVLDSVPLLDAGLMRLAGWMAHYYLAPLGEVFRAMLPLGGSMRRAHAYTLTDRGLEALHRSAQAGTAASGRSRRPAEERMAEYRVLDQLAGAGPLREATLRSSGASRRVLAALARKKWVTRADVSAPQEPSRRRPRHASVAVLKNAEGRLNANQRKIVETLAAAGGRAAVELLRELPAPRSTLATLVRRGVVELVEGPGVAERPRFPVVGGASGHELNAQQNAALERMRAAVAAQRFSVSLLHGVTGSGKTAVYLAAMREVLAAGRSAILLVPEIGLTPAAAAHLDQIFGEQVALLHSGLSAPERAQQWHRIRRGEARIVVGTRSAVFAPVTGLALIVVDEEHDGSYKQEETPRYHGRDVAVMRGKLAGAAVVLSSATPSLESYYNAQSQKYALMELGERVERRPLPEVSVVDMRREFQETEEDRLFSRELLAQIGARLERREQAMILLNRRGYSAAVLCRACGETLQCRNCAIAMTHHKATRRLLCHYCGHQQPVPRACGKCGSEYVFFLGAGAEKLEEQLHAAFPQARIGRLDRDTVRGRHHLQRVLGQFHAGELDLLVGTQMIAKGHDVHGVTLVGVVGADLALGFPDFRAAERTFQLLTQVAGRAGRGQTPGRVILQTYFPDHYAIRFAAAHDYRGFYEQELRYRRWMHYPPFTALATVLVRSQNLAQALKVSGLLGRWLEKKPQPGLRVLGPAAAPIVRLKRDYRYHFVLKSDSREKLNAVSRAMMDYAGSAGVPRTTVVVDVDPMSMM